MTAVCEVHGMGGGSSLHDEVSGHRRMTAVHFVIKNLCPIFMFVAVRAMGA
jgi:hypothetical protein